MTSKTILYLVYILAVILLSLTILLIPIKTLAAITQSFSLKTFGIRKIKRWKSRTDTLANFFLWISVLFSIFFPVIPYSKWIYCIWLTFTWLCTLSRAVRLTGVKSLNKKLIVIFFINCIYGFGLLCSLGAFNRDGLWVIAHTFYDDLVSGYAFQFAYLLWSINICGYVLQFLLLMLPAVWLWAQFKYMRLENSFNSRNIVFYIIKSVLQVLILLFLGIMGLPLVEDLYNIETENRLTQSISIPFLYTSIEREQ